MASGNGKTRVELVSTSTLPSHDLFKPKPGAPVDPSSLSINQRLVLENRRRAELENLRRRNTLEVVKALAQTPVEIGSQIWIPDPEKVWRRVEIQSYRDDVEKGMILEVVGQYGKETVDLRELGDLYRVNPRVVDDMTALYYIHEAGILENLYARSRPDHLRPYTLMANVLIAVNPLVRIVEPKIQDYIKTQMGDKAPHPYAIAEVAFQQMALRTPAQCQSIVISGESGAGKTETSKIVLRYLTSREHLSATKGKPTATTALSPVSNAGNNNQQALAIELDKRLWDTNPILEAFGNAKTLRNHNSSRFGKFMKLQFDPVTTTLTGAFIETYLLEKFRVVAQIPGERNFHIFYFLLAGADDTMRKELELRTVDEYAYLNQSGCVSDPNIDDELLFDEVVSALASVGIDAAMQRHVWTVLAGLLHLGNIQLTNRETAEGDAGEVTSSTALASLKACATLLGVDAASLTRVITEREISTRGEVFTIKRSAKEGGYVRDAIAKSMYNQLFQWIVLQINQSLGHGASTLPFIGVLDIFGFESFDVNDFEQLLINYANEALQATFNQQVFIAEQELFTQEGIEIGKIAWPDNRDCIDLIAAKPNGLLPLLDQEARTPKPSDEKWNVTLHKTHAGHAHFLAPHEKDKKFVFIVKHFATRVPYTVGNFIDKNNDTIPKDLEDFVMSSKSTLIKSVYTMDQSSSMDTSSSGPASRKVVSVSGKFCAQMQDLVDTLNATRCNFIRCIKPNPTMTPGVFDHGYVVDQLRCTGMLATCELLKVGLPTRVSYEEICRIYKPVLPDTVTPMFAQYNDRTFTEAVLWSFRVDPDAYRLGRTKVFFKTGKIALLDALLKVDMKKMGPWIVSRLRKWLARRRWRYATAKIMAQKAFVWLLEYTRKRKAAIIKIQSVLRMYQVRKLFIKTRNAYRNRMRRKALARKRWRTAIRAIVAGNALKDLLQRARARLAAQQQQRNGAAIKIQAIVRGKLGRKKAIKRRQQIEEAKLRKRLQEEAAAAALAKAKSAKRHWHSAVYTVIAQRHFAKRLQHIRKARLAVEEAKRRAEEQQRLLLQQQEEERQRMLQAQREEEERQRLLALKRAAAAVVIQRAVRRCLAKAEGRRQLTLLRAQHASMAAALAAQEAARAAEDASMAHQAEADALRRLSALEQAQKANMGTLGTVGTVGALGVAGGLQGATLGSVEPMPAVVGQAGELGAVGSVGVAGALVGQETLQNADLSWMAQENVKIEGHAVAGEAFNQEQLAQAGRDLFGEGNEMPQGPLLSADDDNLMNPVRRIQEFATGPPIPYKGGILTCTMLGHRKLQDENWGDEYTEYVMRITWGRDILEQSKTSWLIGGRYNDFNALHQELKAAASGRRGKRAPWFPRFPKRHPFSSMMGKNQEEKFITKREKELNRYMTQVLTQMPDALLNIHMDRFLNLTMRTTDISEREAYAEARKRWEEEEREALANAAEAEPLNDAELHEVEQLVHQLLQKVIYSAGDVRQDTELQEMIHAVKVLQPRVAASAQIGANVNMELVPLAMQLQDDIQDAFNQYNDTLLALRLGQDF